MAFVKFWFEQLNTAYTKPDATLLPALSTAECKSCKSLQVEPAKYVQLKQKMDNSPTKPLRRARALPGAPPGSQFVQFTLEQTAVTVRDEAGKVVDTQEAKSFERVAIVRWEGASWKLNGLADPN